MKTIVLLLIRMYQQTISPDHGLIRNILPIHRVCRFTPTCSQYMYEAIEQYGILNGSFVGLRRLLRCHPFHPGGYDPITTS